MKQKLSEETLQQLRILEPRLRNAVKYGDLPTAELITKAIQQLFINNRYHHRVLQAKNYYFQAVLEDNKIDSAVRGFNNVRIRANKKTRTYLEATILLGICYLRKKSIEKAKQYIRESILTINNIKSDSRRHQFQKRIIERIEFECILGQISDKSISTLSAEDIQEQAIQLIKTKSDQEIFGLVGSTVPQGALQLTQDIKNYSVKLLPLGDQKLLAPPPSVSVFEFGKKIVETVKRVGWRSVCDQKSHLYNLWKNQVPELFNKGYFASAMAATCAKFSIGLPILVGGVVAILMRYSAADFCERYKPKDIMIPKNEKD